MLRMTTEDKNEMFRFDSMSDLREYTDPRLFKSGDASFVGERIDTMQDADTKMTIPWEDGLQTTARFVQQLRALELPDPKSRKSYTAWSYTEGDEIDQERLMAGLPFMRSQKRETTEGPGELTIFIDTTTPAFERSANILWRGAAGIALAQLLEEKGYRCEIWVVNGSQLFAGKRCGVMTATKLKSCGDPLDVSTLTNAVSGWLYRSVVFTLLSTICRKAGEYVAGGFGMAWTPSEYDLDSISKDPVRVYISGVFSFDGAATLLEREVNKLIEGTTGARAAKEEPTTEESSTFDAYQEFEPEDNADEDNADEDDCED